MAVWVTRTQLSLWRGVYKTLYFVMQRWIQFYYAFRNPWVNDLFRPCKCNSPKSNCYDTYAVHDHLVLNIADAGALVLLAVSDQQDVLVVSPTQCLVNSNKLFQNYVQIVFTGSALRNIQRKHEKPNRVKLVFLVIARQTNVYLSELLKSWYKCKINTVNQWYYFDRFWKKNTHLRIQYGRHFPFVFHH